MEQEIEKSLAIIKSEMGKIQHKCPRLTWLEFGLYYGKYRQATGNTKGSLSNANFEAKEIIRYGS